MNQTKTTPFSRLLAALLATVLLISLLPLSALPVYAEDVPIGGSDSAGPISETQSVEDSVSVIVKDEGGAPIRDALVSFTVHLTFEDEDGSTQTFAPLTEYPSYTNEEGKATVTYCYGDDYTEPQLTLCATVEKDGWDYADDSGIIDDEPIPDNKEFTVSMTIPKDAVVVNPELVPYNGQAQPLVKLNNTLEGDQLTYLLNNEPVNDLPSATDAGSYAVKVTVSRENCTDRDFSFNSIKIQKGEITGVEVHSETAPYTGHQIPLVDSITGLQSGDQVTIRYKNKNYNYTCPAGSTIIIPEDGPSEKKAGTYSFTVTVHRPKDPEHPSDSNYQDLTIPGSRTISRVSFENQFSFEVYTGPNGTTPVYDVAPHDAVVTVQRTGSNENILNDTETYNFAYQYVKADTKPDGWPAEDGWDEAMPQVENAGTYQIAVRVALNDSDDNYTENTAVLTKPLTINKRDQVLTFLHVEEDQHTIFFDYNAETNTFDFQCISDCSDAVLSYTLINRTPDDVAAINSETGLATLNKPGRFRVRVVSTGNDNYNPCGDDDFNWDVTVTSRDGNVVYFEQETVTYELDTTGSCRQAAIRTHQDDGDNGTLTYYFMNQNTDTTYGLYINPNNGTVSVTDWAKLHEKMSNASSHTVSVVVSVKKAVVYGWGFSIAHPEGTASYTLKIKYHDGFPSGSVKKSDPAGTEWYNASSPAKVLVADSAPYLISTEARPNNINQTEIEINDQIKEGDSKSYTVYVKDSTANAETGKTYLYQPINFEFTKIDTFAPIPENVNVEYLQWVSKREDSRPTFYFFNPLQLTANIVFDAASENVDATSGPASVHWYYTRAIDVSEENIEETDGTVAVGSDGKAILELPLEQGQQYRGSLVYDVTDKAGNTSAYTVDDSGNIIVIDSIAPNCTIEYAEPEPISQAVDAESGKKIWFYDSAVKAKLDIIENNFWTEDFNLYVSKDGDDPQKVNIEWDQAESTNKEAFGSYVLEGDGDYVVYANYSDRSGNEGEFEDSYGPSRIKAPDVEPQSFLYESNIISIDMTPPQLGFTYESEQTHEQTLTYKLTERNFRLDTSKSLFSADITIQDRNGKELYDDSVRDRLLEAFNNRSNWSKSDETNTYVYKVDTFDVDLYPDGIYNIKLTYTDPAGNQGSVTTGEFIVDHTGPTDLAITFSDPLKKAEINGKNYWYYNPNIEQATVTFSATDPISGVTEIKWSYQLEDNASQKVNEPDYSTKDQNINEIQGTSRFTDTVTLPWGSKDLRGTFGFKAWDQKENVNGENPVTDDTVIVVDRIAPTIEVSYSEASSIDSAKNIRYYGINKGGKATVTMTIEEANFYAEDVVIKLTKDGADSSLPAVSWSDRSADVHVGEFTLNGDGHYVVTVNYTDRSQNTMREFKSDTIVLDNTKPVITVIYQNHNGNTMRDENGNNRTYFNQEQVAVVKIVERNFNSEDVKFEITSKDVTGANLSDPRYRMSGWTDNGETHILTINYPGDANYSFDVSYTDLATNAADDYAPDYFTVDKTAPKITGITYSPAVYSDDKIGYYDKQMTVTVTVEDDTSGVNSFLHDYADGSSSITMSNGGRTATITFNIPTGALGANNQFNGTVKFSVIDRSGNKTDGETKTLVLDNIAPVMEVSYSPAKQESAGNHDYYNGPITVTVKVTEANFFPEDFRLVLNGQTFTINNWTSSNGVHTGSFVLQQDGEYKFEIDYTDRSGNKMEHYDSNVLVIDTGIEGPSFTINGEAITKTDEQDPSLYLGGAKAEDARIGFSFGDENFKSYTIKLEQTNYSKKADVTDKLVSKVIAKSFKLDDPGAQSFNNVSFEIPKEVEYDGIYLLTITMTDRAGHTVTSKLKFTVNRYGSVYEYSPDLLELIDNGGAFVQIVDGDIWIREYNANEVEDGSVHILVTRDGVPVETSPQIDTLNNDGVAWYQYEYTILPGTFDKDGYYQITVSSKDADLNTSTSVPENLISRHADGTPYLDTMSFTVDTVPPEIRNIVNLEKPIADRDKIVDGKLPVTYTLIDVGGLRSVEITIDINGEIQETYFIDFTSEEFKGDIIYNYTGTFEIPENSEIQHVRLYVEDMAGNWTDTDKGFSNDPDKEFSTDLFVFNKDVTVSTNALVRWYRNTPVFWGTIGGVGALGSGFGFFFAKKRKKDEDEVVPEGEQKA